MAQNSPIEWTEATWNPTTGCDRTSPGCDNCYALTLAKRLKAMGVERYAKDGDPRTSGPGFGLTTHEDVLDVPIRWKQPRLVFVNSMSDLFHDGVSEDYIQAVFQVMKETPRHTYQVLTKRSKRLLRLAHRLEWPTNVWMGVSVESARYRFRIDHLRQVPTSSASAVPKLCSSTMSSRGTRTTSRAAPVLRPMAVSPSSTGTRARVATRMEAPARRSCWPRRRAERRCSGATSSSRWSSEMRTAVAN